MDFSIAFLCMRDDPMHLVRKRGARRTFTSLMQDSVTSLFSGIAAQAEIQKMLIRHIFISWTPACAGVTILFASSY